MALMLLPRISRPPTDLQKATVPSGVKHGRDRVHHLGIIVRYEAQQGEGPNRPYLHPRSKSRLYPDLTLLLFVTA